MLTAPKSVGLFGGVGGIELGLEWAGIEPAAFVERDPYCQKVLAHHWPTVPQHDDVTTFPAWWAEQEITADVITAGFPCQPFSHAGKQLGTDDERWMWPATADAIRAVRPSYVVLENVSALVADGDAFGWVLRDLHELGFDAEWGTVRASDYGAPTPRKRVYVLAYAARVNGQSRRGVGSRRIGRAPIAVGGLPRLEVPERGRAADAWLAREPRVDRLADGIPSQVDRLRSAGNAAVPQISHVIGQAIMADWSAAA